MKFIKLFPLIAGDFLLGLLLIAVLTQSPLNLGFAGFLLISIFAISMAIMLLYTVMKD